MPLPEQPPQLIEPVTPVAVTATSGRASYSIDGFNDRYNYTVWQSSTSLPQSVTIDLGQIYPDISMLAYVPKYVPYISPREEGSIQEYRILTSTDNSSFTKVMSGNWKGDISMKTEVFEPAVARYVRLEVRSGVNGFGAATEIAIGRGSHYEPTGIFIAQKSCSETQIYPNPASGKILVPRAGEYISCEILDMTGRSVWKGVVEESIDIQGFGNGLYLFRGFKHEGGISVSEFIITR
jgi:hypothetical protein